MENLQQNIINALDGVFSTGRITKDDRQILATVQREIAAMPATEKRTFASELLDLTYPCDNPFALYFYLYDCFLDVRFLEKSDEFVPSCLPLPQFYEFYWNMSQRLFTSTTGSKIIPGVLRRLYQENAKHLKSFLESRNIVKASPNLGPPRTIAILSPQILNMRHSPTREAFSIALHLTRYCGCTCYIFNTNSMNYEGENRLNLVSFSKYNVNEELKGGQKVRIKYMDFNNDVNIISFEAGAMTTQKIAGIADATHQLKIDAVIAHGENLLVMEALYNKLPSLFATTGSVVPYNHCDAYFVPQALLDERTVARAAEFGHLGEFMAETMLSTPEGIAEKAIDRQTFGIPDRSRTYLVVGTRLESEITPDFVQVCVRVLKSQSDSVIVFAGSPSLNLIKLFGDAYVTEKRIFNIGFQQDLPGISAMSQVYLNPERLGGGTSAQTAIINGLPIVTLAKGHISAIVPESMRMPDWEEYLMYIERLRDNAFYSEQVQKLKRHFSENGNTRTQVEKIYDKLCEISLTYSR